MKKLKIPGYPGKRLDRIEFLPGFESWRQDQQETISCILDQIENGMETIFIQAPTGVGKSIIGYAAAFNQRSPFYLLTMFKSLQDQYMMDFNKPEVGLNLRDIRGRSNFICNLEPTNTAAEGKCTYDKDYQGKLCPERINCNYYRARTEALASNETVTNPDYLLSLLHVSEMIARRPVSIWDECHMLPGKLIDHFAVKLTENQWDRYGMSGDFPEYEQFGDWLEPIEKLTDILMSKLTGLIQEYNSSLIESEKKKIGKTLNGMKEKLNKFNTMMDCRDMGWVVINTNFTSSRGNIIRSVDFKPVTIEKYGRELFEKISIQRIFMSATVLNPELICRDLGLDPDTAVLIDITRCPFPVANRLIQVETNHGSMKWKERPITLPNICSRINDIVQSRTVEQEKRGLILPFTKGIQKSIISSLAEFLGDDPEPISNSGGNGFIIWDYDYKKAVDEFLRFPDVPQVLFSTVNAGLDFKGKLAEYLILPKAPTPNIKDPWVATRMKRKIDGNPGEGWNWYWWSVIVQLIQAAGRVVRSKTDVSEIFVLDNHIAEIIRKNHYRFPTWFTESLRFDGKEEDFGNRNSRFGSGISLGGGIKLPASQKKKSAGIVVGKQIRLG